MTATPAGKLAAAYAPHQVDADKHVVTVTALDGREIHSWSCVGPPERALSTTVVYYRSIAKVGALAAYTGEEAVRVTCEGKSEMVR